MAIPKQPVSVFFGATDQDTSKKGVKLGNLITASNVQQIKGGELTKRYGFTETAQTYAGFNSIEPESYVSPDGIQRLVRDRVTDTVFAIGATDAANANQGAAIRYLPKWDIRFPALQSGLQVAPMAKQAGDFMVWLEDSKHFRVARTNRSAESTKTNDAESLVLESASIPAEADGSTNVLVRSFTICNSSDFDADNLWIFWVGTDFPGVGWSIKYLKVSKTSLSVVVSGESYQRAGGGGNTWLTSIDCAVVNTAAGKRLFLAAVGTLTHESGYPGFQQYLGLNMGTTLTTHYFVDPTSGYPLGSPINSTGYANKQTASGCCILSGYSQNDAAYVYFAFVGNTYLGAPNDNVHQGIIVRRVSTADPSTTQTYSYEVTLPAMPAIGSAATPPLWENGQFGEGWKIIGQITGYEDGAYPTLCTTVNWYYRGSDQALYPMNPDRQTVLQLKLTGGSLVPQWEARGSWLAHGWLMMRDLTDYPAAADGGAAYVITGYEDKGALQCCYHLRRWADGEIVAQFAYTEGAHSGGCGAQSTQMRDYVTDLNQCMNSSVDGAFYVSNGCPAVLLGLQSSNVENCVDVSRVLFAVVRPIFQNPSVFRQVELAPGPIPTVASGWQKLREAGPLLYPSEIEAYVGVPST